MQTQLSKKIVVLGSWMLLGFASPVLASNIENLAKSLAKIRGEVEALQSQLDIEKEKYSSKMSALNSQLADLSVEERRQKLSIEKLQQSIDLLPDEFKIPLILFYFKEFSYKEIAQQLDVPLGTVMSRLSRAKAFLKKHLGDGEV